MNARQFVDEIVEVLKAKGREVTVEETDESFGKMVWVSATSPNWWMSPIHLSAFCSDSTKRWRLGEIKVRTISGKTVVAKTRYKVRIIADVYG
jgi:hypothetical protein